MILGPTATKAPNTLFAYLAFFLPQRLQFHGSFKSSKILNAFIMKGPFS